MTGLLEGADLEDAKRIFPTTLVQCRFSRDCNALFAFVYALSHIILLTSND